MIFRPKRELHGRSILITGASSGIGAALAHAFAAHQTKLLLTARRRERLDELKNELETLGARVAVVAGDITDATHRVAVLETVAREFGGLDILVNNAGLGGIGSFATADEERLRKIMEVNFFAPFELIRGALPMLQESDDGVVVNIASVLGHFAVPKKSEYCASKFAMHGMTDALRMELNAHGIDVLLVSPSTTRSEFFDHAMRSAGDAATNRWAMSPSRVAAATIRSIQRRRREAILPIGGRLMVVANRLFPGTLSRILSRYA